MHNALGSVHSIWKNKANNQHTVEASAAVNVENQDYRNPKLSLQPIPFLAEETLGGLKIQQSLSASQQYKDLDPHPSDSGVLILLPPYRSKKMFASEAPEFRSLR